MRYEETTGDFEWQTCGTGSGDAISIDSVAVTDPDFVSSGDIDFVDSSNTVTANINANVVDAAAIDETDDYTWSGTNVFSATATFSGTINLPTLDELVFDERADHVSTPGAGKGYLWVKNDTPSSLYFTDDAGTDYDLSASLTEGSSESGWGRAVIG